MQSKMNDIFWDPGNLFSLPSCRHTESLLQGNQAKLPVYFIVLSFRVSSLTVIRLVNFDNHLLVLTACSVATVFCTEIGIF